ncbi:unnamed protein product [Ectocarpus sp. 6 AP-2014]
MGRLLLRTCRECYVRLFFPSRTDYTLKDKMARGGAWNANICTCMPARPFNNLEFRLENNSTRLRSTNVADNSPLPLMCSRGSQPPQDIKSPIPAQRTTRSCPRNSSSTPAKLWSPGTTSATPHSFLGAQRVHTAA